MTYRGLSALALLCSACTFDVSGIAVHGSTDAPVAFDLGGNGDALPAGDLAGLCTPDGPASACSADGTTLLH